MERLARRALLLVPASTVLASCLLLVRVPDGATGGGLPDVEEGEDAETGTVSAPVSPSPPPSVPPCDLASPFDDLHIVAGLNLSAHEFRPTLSSDERIVVYTRAGWGVLEAHRPNRTSLFGEPVGMLSPPAETTSLSPDGLTLYFANVTDAGGEDIFRLIRGNVAGAWPTEASTLGPLLDSADREADPYIVGRSLYFSSNRGGDDDLYEALLDDADSVTDVHPVAGSGVNLHPGSEFAPVLSEDRLRLYFGSDRPFGAGGLDIWLAVRASESDAFGQPTNVAELNSRSADSPGWLSPDGCRLYFSSDRVDGGAGATDVWVAEKPAR